MNQQEEISLIKKQNELILERLNSLDDGTFAVLSTNIRRPSTSSATSPVDMSSLSARENIRRPSTSSTTFPVDVSSLLAHGNSCRPSTSSTTSPVDVSSLSARGNIRRPSTSSTTFPVDFKIKTKDLNISLGYNDWFAYKLLKKHVQHVRDHKAKTINGYFTKRTRSRGEERPVEKNVEESGGDKEERESKGEEAAAEIEIRDDFNSKEAAAEIEIRDDSDSKEAAAEIEIRDDSDSDIDEDLERQLLNLFRKRYKKTGGTDSSKDEELERNLIREIRKKEKEVEEKEKEIEEKEKEIEEKEKEIKEKKMKQPQEVDVPYAKGQ
ncbi:uncharacterized protein OCT59_001361 [Rhizophagus irregularis]|uniref:uncharacterized protein n=1 Tax=Rhizophagus irregularis TaxID=588596 RepID=UPI00331837C6|nr:hypothetical protein OCT59_001361 [Rhizophagus irregularis]